MQIAGTTDNSQETASTEEIIQFLSFSVSNELFGIDLVNVHEILRPAFITRIPNVEEFVLGVINLRGEIIPIVDLKKNLIRVLQKLQRFPELLCLNTIQKDLV